MSLKAGSPACAGLFLFVLAKREAVCTVVMRSQRNPSLCKPYRQYQRTAALKHRSTASTAEYAKSLILKDFIFLNRIFSATQGLKLHDQRVRPR